MQFRVESSTKAASVKAGGRNDTRRTTLVTGTVNRAVEIWLQLLATGWVT